MEADLDGIRCDAEDLGRLFGRAFFDVAKEQHRAIRLRQAIDRAADKSTQLGALKNRLRRLGPWRARLDLVAILEKAREVLLDVLLRAAALRPQLHQAGIHLNAV